MQALMSLSNGPPQSDSEQATAGSATAVSGVTPDAGDSSKDGDGSSGMLKILETLIREDVWVRISRTAGARVPKLQQWKGKRLVGINCSPLSVRGFGKVPDTPIERHAATGDSDLTVHEAILGLNFVERTQPVRKQYT
eukprot:Em0001g2094a